MARKPNPQAAQKRAAIADRRQRVKELYLKRVPVEEIARVLGVHSVTIYRDVTAISKDWAKSDRKTDLVQVRGRALRELDMMETRAAYEFEILILKRDQLSPPPKSGQVDMKPFEASDYEKIDREARAWMDLRLKIQERRAKLLGLDLDKTPALPPTISLPITFVRVTPRELPAGATVSIPGQVVEGEVVENASDPVGTNPSH